MEFSEIKRVVSENFPYTQSLRRALHEIPEVGLFLPKTQFLVCAELEKFGYAVERNEESSGLSLVVNPDGGDTLVFRCDMDALPVFEPEGLSFRSKHDGSMHACGHDLHTAIMVTVAKILSEDNPKKKIVLAFQSGEEFDRGAIPLLKHKNLAEVHVAQSFALHTHANLPSGTLNWKNDSFMGFGDWFEIQVTGLGGHGASPHKANTPITPAANIALAINSLTDLLAKPWPTQVATVTEILSGNSVNVIPPNASLRGTIRGKDFESISYVRSKLAEIVANTQEQFQVKVDLKIKEGYPAVINSSASNDFAKLCLAKLPEKPVVNELPETSMVIEDYSYFLQKWPGAMFYLGCQLDDSQFFNHSEKVKFNEEAMKSGVEFFLALAYS